MEPLEQQRIEFAHRKFLATSISKLIAWMLLGLSGLLFEDRITV